MSSSDNSEDNNKIDDPYERMLVFLTGKRSEDRKSKEKAIRFPVKVRQRSTPTRAAARPVPINLSLPHHSSLNEITLLHSSYPAKKSSFVCGFVSYIYF